MPNISTHKQKLRQMLSILLVLLLSATGEGGDAQAQRERLNYELLQTIREVKNNLSKKEAQPGTPRADALIQKVTRLLEQGADPNLRDEEPKTRRFLPPRSKRDPLSTGYPLIFMLPRHWHNVNHITKVDKRGGMTITMGLVISEDDELVTILFRELLDKGANINTRDSAGGTPLLSQTIGDGYWECAEMLIERGAKVNVADKEGLTPLHEAARIGHAPSLKMLLDAGANIHAKNQAGDTPLHYAVIYSKVDCARLLKEAGANINARNHEGDTPLMSSSANSGSVETIQWMLSTGADIHARNKKGKTALAYAKTYDNIKILPLLRKAGAK